MGNYLPLKDENVMKKENPNNSTQSRFTSGRYFVFIFLLLFPVSALATNHCPPLELSAEDVHEIIKKEREKRDDLPSAYPEYEVRKSGCYYIYQEFELPRKPEDGQIFQLNRFGVIVSVSVGGGEWDEMKCPEKVFSEEELTEIIKNARKTQDDLPSPYLNYEIITVKSHCQYFYQERDLSEGQDGSVMFMIDPFGELMTYHQQKSN